MDELLCN